MASFEFRFKESVSKDLRPIPNRDVARILTRVSALSEEPRPPGSEKLSGQERYRVRQGVYRILYEIDNDERVITIVAIGHRREIYKRN